MTIPAIFLAPPLSIGACTVQEMFFAYERGQKMGLWGKRYVNLARNQEPTSTYCLFISSDGYHRPAIRSCGVFYPFVSSPFHMALIGLPSVGYLVQLKGWRAAFYLLAAIHLALFVAHIFLGPETLFLDRDEKDEEVKASRSKGRWRQYVHFGILNRTPLQTIEFIRPFLLFIRPVVLLPSIAYAFVFAYTNVLVVRYSFKCMIYG